MKKKYEMIKQYRNHTLWRVILENGRSYLESFRNGFNPNVDKEGLTINTYLSVHRYDEIVGDGHIVKMDCGKYKSEGCIKSRKI